MLPVGLNVTVTPASVTEVSKSLSTGCFIAARVVERLANNHR
jgi:hypothetical protein